MSAHTPTPWHVNGWDVVAQPSIKWHVVATTARLEYDDKDRERDANAAYIVECVNGHAELLATTAKLRERNEVLVHGLTKAIALIKEYHDCDSVWDIYLNNAPEMKPIVAALSSTTP